MIGTSHEEMQLVSNNCLDFELFAGAGGMAVGLQDAGFSPATLYEYDKSACDTLRYNIQSKKPTIVGKVVEQDVTKITWNTKSRDIRLLAAGAPCQPFSLGGRHLAEQDGRNLFPQVLTALRALRPKAVLLENVRGLLRSTFQPYFDYIIRQLECPIIEPHHQELWQNHNERIRKYQCSTEYQPEYQVTWRLLDAADYGVPQNRQRVFIVATRKDLPTFKFPAPTHSRQSLCQSFTNGNYRHRHKLKLNHLFPELSSKIKECRLKPWLTVRDVLRNLPEAALNDKESEMNHYRIPGARRYAGHGGSVLDLPSKTIKAGVHGVPGGENTVIEDNGNFRYFTLRETARIQTFPDNHFFSGARIHVTRQIGNAVPPDLAQSVAVKLFELLNSQKGEHRELTATRI